MSLTINISKYGHKPTWFDPTKEYSEFYRKTGTYKFKRTAAFNEFFSIDMDQKGNVNTFEVSDFYKRLKSQIEINNSSFEKIDSNFIRKISGEVYLGLHKLSVKNIEFNLTSDISAFFQFENDSYSCYMEVFFDEQNEDDVEVILNTYDINGIAKGYSGTIDEMLNEIEKNNKTKYKTYSNRIWEIPTEVTPTTSEVPEYDFATY